jgi:hypothetical protein
VASKRLSAVLGDYADTTKDMGKVRDAAYHAADRGQGWDGFTKSYQPREEGGVGLPPETKLVTMNANELWKEFTDSYGKLINAAATKDYANTKAKAAIIVDGTTLIDNVPAPYLLWLQKALVDFRTFLNRMPVLPADEQWEYDPNRGHHVSKASKTVKTDQRAKPIVLYPHSVEHPAQTQLIKETEIVGDWTTTKFHGGLPRDERKRLLGNVQKLLGAVQAALAEANSVKAEAEEPFQILFDYITR